jgi:hypothetical protein
MVSWFVHQNQVGYSLSVASQNRREDEDSAGHASRSSGLLRLETSQARVSQSSPKTGGGAWHHRGGRVEMKPKTDGSMQRAASDSSTLTLLFS